MKLWINENSFIETEDRKVLSSEIAVRSRSQDWQGFFGWFPDPDEVLRKLGQDLSVYRRLLTDAHVWACCHSRKSSVLSCSWQVKENAAAPGRAGARALDFIADFMDRIDAHQVVTDILEAPLFGMSPIEVTWEASGGRWLPVKVEGKPPEWFLFDLENRLRFRSRDNMIQGEELPERKFLLPRHFASYQNPYGERVLARCFWPAAFKKGGFKFWAVFCEKWGMPWVVGKAPRSANPTERERLLDGLVRMVQDAAAVINNDESVEITEAAGKGASADIYERLIQTGNKEISKAVLGQTATTEGTPGKLGSEDAQNETRADIVEADKKLVEKTFNILFQWIAELNFGGAAAPVFAFDEEEDLQEGRAKRDEALYRQNVRFSKTYYRRAYNLEEGDFEVEAVRARPAQTDEPPLFAENGNGAEDESPAPVLEALGRKALAQADMAALLQPAEKLLAEAGSLEEFRDKLLDLYRGLDVPALGELMQQALVLADLSGRFDAAER